jgi:hypothetical protein
VRQSPLSVPSSSASEKSFPSCSSFEVEGLRQISTLHAHFGLQKGQGCFCFLLRENNMQQVAKQTVVLQRCFGRLADRPQQTRAAIDSYPAVETKMR